MKYKDILLVKLETEAMQSATWEWVDNDKINVQIPAISLWIECQSHP